MSCAAQSAEEGILIGRLKVQLPAELQISALEATARCCTQEVSPDTTVLSGEHCCVICFIELEVIMWT